MNLITLLKEDHKEVEDLFKRIEATSPRAMKTRQKLFLQIKAALTVHSAAEEELLYPRMKEMRELRHDAFLANEEHRLVKQLLDELGSLDAGEEQWDAKMSVLMDMVRHHVREEEGEYFKALKLELNRAELMQLGEEVQAFKERFEMPRETQQQESRPSPSPMNSGQELHA